MASNAEQLIAGYMAYTDSVAYGISAEGIAPNTTPITTVTASSPECATFSVTAASGAITSASVTHAAGC